MELNKWGKFCHLYSMGTEYELDIAKSID